MLMILFGWAGAERRKGTVFESRRWLWIAQYTWPAGFIAILSGWFVTEVGCRHQPRLATGIIRSATQSHRSRRCRSRSRLRCSSASIPSSSPHGILLINRLIDKGLDEISGEDAPEQPSKRPLKAAQGEAAAIFGMRLADEPDPSATGAGQPMNGTPFGRAGSAPP